MTVNLSTLPRLSLSYALLIYEFYMKISFSIFCSILNDPGKIFKVTQGHCYVQYTMYVVYTLFIYLLRLYLYIYISLYIY